MEAKFVDIHAHLSDNRFEGKLDSLAKELKDFLVLNAGEKLTDNEKILLESKKHPNFLPCIGLHPNFISSATEEDVSKSFDYIAKHVKEAFAISEIGLDYRGKDELQISSQKRIFTELLELAELEGKVCIIHSRKAMDDLLKILSSFEAIVIIHNFEGNQAQYTKAVESKAYVSISTGFIKFKRDNLIKKMALDRMFVETDSPVLSPDNELNTPLNIPKILDYISALRGIKQIELKEKIFMNFKKLFYG